MRERTCILFLYVIFGWAAPIPIFVFLFSTFFALGAQQHSLRAKKTPSSSKSGSPEGVVHSAIHQKAVAVADRKKAEEKSAGCFLRSAFL
ncbi:MAG: hypothetical protein II804_00360 [Clostridia bacterium]|nr:hypothetical protein [Clostridia bacterium]